MSGEMAKGFLDDVVSNIDDDVPRLVYADWLMENGQDDRAEFIRVQVEQARLPAWDAAQVRLGLREEALLKQHGEAWLAEMPAIEGVKWEGFRRGIVAEVSFASFEAMRTSAHACRAVAPIEAVTVRWPRKSDPDTGGAPIAELRELSLTGRPGRENVVARLAHSRQLATLRRLTARGLWAEGLGVLVESPHLAGLRTLRLPSNDLGNEGIEALIGAASLSALQELDLSGQGVAERYTDDPTVSPPGMETLASWEGLASVRALSLSGNDLGGPGLQTLLRSSNAGALKKLTLRNTRLDGEAMAVFADARRGIRLETLDVGENLLVNPFAEFASASCLSDLKQLRMDRCEIQAAGARQLVEEMTFLDSLRVLDVGHNEFGAAGLAALLEREPPHALRMRDNDVYDKGATTLAESPASDVLLEVDLSHNALSDTAARALGASAYLRGLLVLRLERNKFSAPAASALAASGLGQRLAVLELGERSA